MILSTFFKKIYMVICFIENGINFGKKFGTFFWKFFYVPEKKKIQNFLSKFLKNFYMVICFIKNGTYFGKKFLNFFWKISFWPKCRPKNKKIFGDFYYFANSLQFSTNIRFLAHPEAEICTKKVFLDGKWHISYNNDVIVTW